MRDINRNGSFAMTMPLTGPICFLKASPSAGAPWRAQEQAVGACQAGIRLFCDWTISLKIPLSSHDIPSANLSRSLRLWARGT
jgi:hypothetical protein